jgi:hypothetical protein
MREAQHVPIASATAMSNDYQYEGRRNAGELLALLEIQMTGMQGISEMTFMFMAKAKMCKTTHMRHTKYNSCKKNVREGTVPCKLNARNIPWAT